MPSYKNYVRQENKTKPTKDMFKEKVNFEKTKDVVGKNQELKEKYKTWTSFYRANIHRFCQDYFGLELKLFQIILLFLMERYNLFMWVGNRGISKSWLIAVYCLARGVLYPGSKIIIASGTKNQSSLIVTEKIDKELRKNYPNIAREIKDLKTGKDACEVILHNGTTITVVSSTDNARGYRGNLLILEEFRLIKLDILNTVLKKFLTAPRQPRYLQKPEYRHLVEKNKEIYISSAWYKHHWIWDKFKAFKTMMLKDKDYFVIANDYKLALHENLLLLDRVENEMQEDDFDPIAWSMEMKTLFYGESASAFFKTAEIEACRTLVKPMIPPNDIEYLQSKDGRRRSKNPFEQAKHSGEIRILAMDIALMAGADNDNTIFTFIRAIPNGSEYIKYVPYIESVNGQHSTKQAIRLKQLYYDFECDFVVMDTSGNGLSVFDDCSKILYDEARDIEYPAWTALNDEKMAERSYEKNALPIIYSLKVAGGSAGQINHEIAMYTKTCLDRKTVKLLVNEIEGKDFMIDKHNLLFQDSAETARLIHPYVQTTRLLSEMVNLESEIRSGFVRLSEVGRNRKDRYSSLSYGLYYIKLLEIDLKNQNEDDSLEDWLSYTGVY